LLGFTYTIRVIFQQKKLATIKNDFINNMTHEFKTPIATIGLAAESIKNPKVYNDLTKLEFYANIIKQENTRMNDQVTNVLRMAQLDKGELKLQFTDQDLHELINNVLQNNRLQIADKNGLVHIDLAAKNHLIKADQTHLSNSINNLIDNAIKYSNDLLDITIKTWNGNEGIYVSVADKGIGMSAESYKKIFESFYRATTGNLHDVKGFGLGLSYAKTIIEQHNGTINVKSEKDKGSTFTIFLPFVNEKAAV
jgi:two-component system phosphate regulon sensor histidine kinase PhoR